MWKVLYSKFCYQNLMIFIILCFHYHVPYWIFHLHPTIKFQEKFVCVWCASLLLLKPIELVCYLHHGMGAILRVHDLFKLSMQMSMTSLKIKQKAERKQKIEKKVCIKQFSETFIIFFFLLNILSQPWALNLIFLAVTSIFFPSLKIYI